MVGKLLKILLVVAAPFAVAGALFLLPGLTAAPDLRKTDFAQLLGLPNARGDCLGNVRYDDLTGAGDELAVVTVKRECGDQAKGVWIYRLINGKPTAVFGAADAPGLVVNNGDVSISQDHALQVREVDANSPLNKSGLFREPQQDAFTIYRWTPGGFSATDKWHDPILVGEVTGTDECLNVRKGPSLSQERVDCIKDGEKVQIVDGPQEADGFTWWAGATGWMAGEYLKLAAQPGGPNAAQSPAPSPSESPAAG